MTDSCAQLADACPACQEADLRPYGNGSKWICPNCSFVLPCCEGSELFPAGRGQAPGSSVLASGLPSELPIGSASG